MRSVPAFALVATLSLSVAGAEPLVSFKDCDVCPEMIELPLGEFIMGAPPDEFPRALVFYDGKVRPATPEHPFRKDDEGPMHRVVVDLPIAMGKNEVTYAEWMACVNDGGCGGYVPSNQIMAVDDAERIIPGLNDERFGSEEYRRVIAKIVEEDDYLFVYGPYPVVYVSYEDAQLYVDWLNGKVGTDAYRLPTEAEWEYAARAGTTTRFAQGDGVDSGQVNFSAGDSEHLLQQDFPEYLSRGFPVPVDELDAANAWGLRHMSGNVIEVTLSCYSERYAGWATTSEWLAKSTGESCERSVRGGGYASSIDMTRPAWRSGHYEDVRAQWEGFRVVKDLDPNLTFNFNE